LKKNHAIIDLIAGFSSGVASYPYVPYKFFIPITYSRFFDTLVNYYFDQNKFPRNIKKLSVLYYAILIYFISHAYVSE